MQKISIIIPVYNQHPWMVEHAINSSLNQYGDFEIEVVVVDDGSTTKWYDYVNLKRPNLSFFKLKENMGVAYAWDYGINNAKHNLICPMACDDYFTPDKLFVQLEYLKRSGLNFSYTAYREYYIDDKNNLTGIRNIPIQYGNITNGKSIFNALISNDYCNNFINGATVIFTKEMYYSIGGYDHNLRYKQDYDLWLRLLNKYDIVGVPIELLIRRIHSNQAKKYFNNDIQLNERTRRSIEYALIKLKWEDTINPVTHPGVDKQILKEYNYL